MTLMRIFVSVFVTVLITLAVSGWVWTGANQPPAGALASRIVLSISVLAGLLALVAVWRWDPSERGASRH